MVLSVVLHRDFFLLFVHASKLHGTPITLLYKYKMFVLTAMHNIYWEPRFLKFKKLMLKLNDLEEKGCLSVNQFVSQTLQIKTKLNKQLNQPAWFAIHRLWCRTSTSSPLIRVCIVFDYKWTNLLQLICWIITF